MKESHHLPVVIRHESTQPAIVLLNARGFAPRSQALAQLMVAISINNAISPTSIEFGPKTKISRQRSDVDM
jgi:hypothetical protein